MTAPLVSVCLPNLNTRPYLEERVDSIRAQTFGDWELVISDNFSDDGSWELFQKYSGDPRVKLGQAPRRGMYANWNQCLRRATGEYVYIATSDDTSYPTMLEKLVGALEKFPSLDLAVCDFDFIDAQSNVVPNTEPNSPKRFFGEWTTIPSFRSGQTEFLVSAVYGPSWTTMTSVLFRRRLLERTGLFRTDVGSQADGEWSMRAALASDIVYLPDTLATWRIHATQATGQWKADLRTFTRNMLTMIESVIADPHSGIPAAWKQIPRWQDELQKLWRWEHWDSFGLFRGIALRQPGRFVRNFVYALGAEPAFALRQACHGFALSPSFTPDRAAETKRLIALFKTPWPPRPL